MSHLEETLERDLGHLRGKLHGMAGLAIRALEQCLEALRSQDRKQAYAVILRDQRIDELEKEVDQLCLEILVRHQPAGAHLRFVYGAIKINAGLERVGDYAESIARQILKTVGVSPFPAIESYEEIARLALPMLADSVKAYLDQDPVRARAAMVLEVEADESRNRINAGLLAMHRQGQLPLELLTPLMTIARRFERVTDQAKNICEEALYVCTGEYAKHPGAEVWRVLFVDEDLGCLGPMAVALGTALGKPRLAFHAAGVEPGPMDPFTRDFMAGMKLEPPVLGGETLAKLPELEHYRLVIGLGRVNPEALQAIPAKAVTLHWPLPDPTEGKGTTAELHAAHEAAHRYLKEHIRDLAEAILGDSDDRQ